MSHPKPPKTTSPSPKRISSLVKLEKITNHEERVEMIRHNQNLSNRSRSNNQSEFSNQSFNKQSLLARLNPIASNSTQKIILTKKVSNPFVKSQERRRVYKLNTEEIEEGSKKGVERVPGALNAEREETISERAIKMYLNCLLTKYYDPSWTIVEQVGQEMTKIKPVWWNLVVTILQNIHRCMKAKPELSGRLSIAYIHLDQEILQNERGLLSSFQDPNHHSLLCESLYFQKLYILFALLFHQELSSDKTFLNCLTEAIKDIITIKRYMVDILLETEQHFLKYNKLKKPSYLIREKKLIQINRLVQEMKELYGKMRRQVNMNRFASFQLKLPCTHESITAKFNRLKKELLEIPEAPFLEIDNPKEYLCLLNPEYILYQEDKKHTCIVLRPFAEGYIEKLSKYCSVVLFFHKKLKTLHPFVKQIDSSKIAKILDSNYYTYRSTKKIVDLGKLGHPLEKIIVIDVHGELYQQAKANCLPFNREATSSEIAQMFQKFLPQLSQHCSAQEIVNSFEIQR